MKEKIHLGKLDYLDPRYISGSLCGLIVGIDRFSYTTDKELVTCKKCLKVKQ